MDGLLALSIKGVQLHKESHITGHIPRVVESIWNHPGPPKYVPNRVALILK